MSSSAGINPSNDLNIYNGKLTVEVDGATSENSSVYGIQTSVYNVHGGEVNVGTGDASAKSSRSISVSAANFNNYSTQKQIYKSGNATGDSSVSYGMDINNKFNFERGEIEVIAGQTTSLGSTYGIRANNILIGNEQTYAPNLGTIDVTVAGSSSADSHGIHSFNNIYVYSGALNIESGDASTSSGSSYAIYSANDALFRTCDVNVKSGSGKKTYTMDEVFKK